LFGAYAPQVLWGRAPPPPARLKQQHLLRRRVRTLALVLAVLVLGWFGVELLTIDGDDLLRLGSLRVLLASALLWLAIRVNRLPPLLGALLLVTLQAALFALMRGLLSDQAPNWLRAGYDLFPFVLVAQLAMLPLAALHSLLLGLPALALALLPLIDGVAPSALIEGLWLFGLLHAVAAWAGATQFGLLLELLTARWDASHDPMTGLANRRSLLTRINIELARQRRHGTPLALLMLDMDHFKSINDRYGHACGDEVIRVTAAVLEAQLRGTDLAGRFGGEEFIVILPDTGLDAALQVAERARTSLERQAIDCGGRQVQVTISIGVAVAIDGDDAEQLIARADAALYAAKAGGRNRVVHQALPPLGPQTPNP
jgi:diguanylate cyclase (GGDEF)-like protein